WHAQLRPDPLYNIPAGLTAGNWFLQQLCSLYNELGINAVRFGDGSYGEASLTKNELFKKLFTQMNRDTLAACKKNRITFFTTLGPYWSFDAWRDELHCDFDKLAAVSEYVIYQTFEGWTDKYGITYVHNGEYFNAGCGNLHLLVNSVLTGKTAYIRGLDSGDPIENWHPPAAMPLRQSLESFTLFCREKDTYCRPCHGVYHFWSQDLDKNYYKKQKKLHNFFQKNQPHKVYGPELVVTRGCKPHLYIMGDFFETSGYGLRTAVSPDNIVPAAGKTYVFFLPRTSGQPVLDETAMTAAEQKQFSNLLASPANIIVFGGAADADFLEYFQLEYTPAEFTPLRWQAGEQEGKWKDHAADSFHPQMAGQKEKYFRKDYLHFKPGGCKVLAAAIAETGEERVLAAAATNPAGGQRMFISGLPTAAVKTVAERTIAASCSLPYRISSAADITSFMWQAENGSVFLAVERYDKIDDAPAIVTVQSGFQLKPVLHSETFRQEQALFIRPHGFIIFKTVN
ncbi:MAG TPA: hypothetical protein VKS21_06265, partial [Spirochaetota bacterium]|nr:hypothetical protein [Spirochaetota bacterium]